jgi:hypothetical protein
MKGLEKSELVDLARLSNNSAIIKLIEAVPVKQ